MRGMFAGVVAVLASVSAASAFWPSDQEIAKAEACAEALAVAPDCVLSLRGERPGDPRGVGQRLAEKGEIAAAAKLREILDDPTGRLAIDIAILVELAETGGREAVDRYMAVRPDLALLAQEPPGPDMLDDAALFQNLLFGLRHGGDPRGALAALDGEIADPRLRRSILTGMIKQLAQAGEVETALAALRRLVATPETGEAPSPWAAMGGIGAGDAEGAAGHLVWRMVLEGRTEEAHAIYREFLPAGNAGWLALYTPHVGAEALAEARRILAFAALVGDAPALLRALRLHAVVRLAGAGRIEEAEAVFALVGEHRTPFVRAIGGALLEAGRFEEAEALFATVEEGDRREFEAMTGAALVEHGRFAEALALWPIAWGGPQARRDIAVAAAAGGDMETARLAFDALEKPWDRRGAIRGMVREPGGGTPDWVLDGGVPFLVSLAALIEEEVYREATFSDIVHALGREELAEQEVAAVLPAHLIAVRLWVLDIREAVAAGDRTAAKVLWERRPPGWHEAPVDRRDGGWAAFWAAWAPLFEMQDTARLAEWLAAPPDEGLREEKIAQVLGRVWSQRLVALGDVRAAVAEARRVGAKEFRSVVFGHVERLVEAGDLAGAIRWLPVIGGGKAALRIWALAAAR